jgi:predicted outer membrane repeat protein
VPIRRFVVSVVFAFTGLCASAQAATITVDSTSDNPLDVGCQLREAINSANGAANDCTPGDPGLDTIDFSLTTPATITLGSTLPLIVGDLAIQGPSGDPADLVIDANSNTRAINAGSANLSLSGLTIENGDTGGSGAAINGASSLTLTDVRLTDNTALLGGAISTGGTVGITSSRLDHNTATAASSTGGAIDAGLNPITVADSQFNHNTAGIGGGAINATTGAITTSGSTGFDTNSLTGNPANGGALSTAGPVTIGGETTFTDNDAGDNGRAGCVFGDVVTVDPGAQFTGNSAHFAGGCLEANRVDIDGATFRANHSEDNYGGAVYLNGSTSASTITDSTFGGPSPVDDGNTAGAEGGAILVADGDLTVSGSDFESNASASAGAIGQNGTGTATVTNSNFTGNSASFNGGGALAATAGSLDVSDSTFASNTSAVEGGGAILAVGTFGAASATVSDSTFAGNSSTGLGGAILADGGLHGGSATLTHDTLDDNQGNAGDLAAQSDGSVTVGRTIITDPDGTDANCATAGNGELLDGGFNLVFNDAGSTCPLGTDGIVGDPNLQIELNQNGGPTQTLLPLSGSAALDAIDPASCQDPQDQRGVDRPVGPACDIGAVEVDSLPDAMVRLGFGSFTGDDVYSRKGAHEKKTLRVPAGATGSFTIRAESDAKFIDDQLGLSGSDGAKGFKVSYERGNHDVTGDVTGPAGLSLGTLSPGDHRDVVLSVKVAKDVARGKRQTFKVRVFSADYDRPDVVKAKVVAK